MSIYKKANTFTGASEKDRFVNTLVGLIFYFICTDIINLIRIPLKKKISRLVEQAKEKRNRRKDDHEKERI